MNNKVEMQTTSAKKPNLRVIGVVLVLSIILIAIGFSTAKWTSETKGETATSVALFAVTAGTDETATALNLNNMDGIDTASYSFWVSNKENGKVSAVTNQYAITVTLAQSAPEGLLLDIDGTIGNASKDRKTFTFSNDDWKMTANVEQQNSHTLNIVADYNVLDSNFSISDIEIIAHIEQAD